MHEWMEELQQQSKFDANCIMMQKVEDEFFVAERFNLQLLGCADEECYLDNLKSEMRVVRCFKWFEIVEFINWLSDSKNLNDVKFVSNWVSSESDWTLSFLTRNT